MELEYRFIGCWYYIQVFAHKKTNPIFMTAFELKVNNQKFTFFLDSWTNLTVDNLYEFNKLDFINKIEKSDCSFEWSCLSKLSSLDLITNSNELINNVKHSELFLERFKPKEVSENISQIIFKSFSSNFDTQKYKNILYQIINNIIKEYQEPISLNTFENQFTIIHNYYKEHLSDYSYNLEYSKDAIKIANIVYDSNKFDNDFAEEKINHYSNLSNGIYSKIIDNPDDRFLIICNEVKTSNYTSLILLDSLFNSHTTEVYIGNQNKKDLSIAFEKKSTNDDKSLPINLNIIFRGTKGNIASYFWHYFKSYCLNWWIFKDELKMMKLYIKLLQKNDQKIYVSGHSYGARNAEVFSNKLNKEGLNCDRILLSLPFSNDKQIEKNEDGIIYKYDYNTFNISHLKDSVTLIKTYTYEAIMVLFIVSIFTAIFTNNIIFSYFLICLAIIGVITKFINNLKYHDSDSLRNHRPLFDKHRTLAENFCYKDNLIKNTNKIKEIFNILDGKIASHESFGFFDYGDRQEIFETPVWEFEKRHEEYINSNTNHREIFIKCIRLNQGKDFSSFFDNQNIRNFLSEYKSNDEITAMKEDLEIFFEYISKLKFTKIN